MPVTGTPTTPIIISVDQIRMFMQDKAENNILLDAVQFTQDQVNFAIEMATEAYNAMTPISFESPSTFPNKYALLLGATKFLMMSTVFLQIRNQATVQDGDVVNIGIDDKQAAYAQLYNLLRGEWEEIIRAIKNQRNMEGATNDLGSGYRNILYRG
jgi:hypothetical protein